MEQKWFQEETQTAVWSAPVSKRFMGRNDSSCRSWAGLLERKRKHQSITNIFEEQHHLSPQGHHTELFSGGGEDLECIEAYVLITLREVSKVSGMRRGHHSLGHLTCLCWPLKPCVHGIWTPEVATSRPPFWPAECLTPFSQKVKQFAPAPGDLSPSLVPLRYESVLTSVAFISSACY